MTAIGIGSVKLPLVPLRGAWGSMCVAAMALAAVQANPARVFAQTPTSWTSGTGAWSNAAKWTNGVPGGANATATFQTAGGTATLTSNTVIGNITTLATSARSRINLTTSEELQFATTTGTAPTVTNTGRAEIAAIITGSQGYTKAGSGDLYVWAPNTYSGVTTISAGRIRLQTTSGTSGLGATGAGNGTVVQSAGTLMLDGDVTVGPESLTISGTGHTSNQGSLRQQTGNGTFTGPITLSGNGRVTANPGASLTLTGAISLGGNLLEFGDNGAFTVSGGIDGTGNVDYVGTGGLILSGSNTFIGTTTVTNLGAPVVMNGYLAGPMNFTGVSGRNLIGSGTFAGGLFVGNGAVLAPGAAVAADYRTLTSSALEVQSGTVTLGILDAMTYDRLVLTAGANGLTLGGNATLSLDFAGQLPDSTALQVIGFTGLTGGWQSIVSTGSYAGTWTQSVDLDVWSLANVGAGGSQTLTFTQSTGVLAFVPEPSTIGFLGGAGVLAALAHLRRRRRMP